MKKIKKTLVLLLAALMVACAVPTGVFAAVGTMTAVTIKGESLGAVNFAAKTDVFATIDDAKANTLELELTPAQLADTMTTVGFTGAGTDAKELIIPVGTPENVNAGSDISGVAKTHTAALNPGDVIWLMDGTASDAVYLRVQINQKSGGTIDGNSTVKTAIKNVVLPANLNFALDPLQISNVTEGSQITSTSYPIVNKSESPVYVSITVTENSVNGATLVDKSAVDPAGNAKELYFALLGAGKTIGGTAPDFTNNAVGAAFNYDAAKPTLVPFNTGGTRDARIEFFLGGLQNSTTLAANNGGVASFQFYGELEPYATWQDNDVKVSGTYTLQARKTGDYKAPGAVGNPYVPGGLNQMPLTPYTENGFIGTAGAPVNTIAVTVSKAATKNTEIPFYSGGLDTSTATLKITPTTNGAAKDFELTSDALVLKADATSIFTIGNPNTYGMQLILGGKTYNVNLTLTE